MYRYFAFQCVNNATIKSMQEISKLYYMATSFCSWLEFSQSDSLVSLNLLNHTTSSRPELAASSYALTTFPNKELTDDTQTLSGADLFDTVVTQETDLEWK